MQNLYLCHLSVVSDSIVLFIHVFCASNDVVISKRLCPVLKVQIINTYMYSECYNLYTHIAFIGHNSVVNP